jgi:hypothetical protein
LNIPGGDINADVGTPVREMRKKYSTVLNIPGGDLNADIGTHVIDAYEILNGNT